MCTEEYHDLSQFGGLAPGLGSFTCLRTLAPALGAGLRLRQLAKKSTGYGILLGIADGENRSLGDGWFLGSLGWLWKLDMPAYLIRS